MFCIILFNDSSVSILAKIMIKYSGIFVNYRNGMRFLINETIVL